MAGGAAAVAAIIQAIKASGVLIGVEPPEFLKIVERVKEPLVVVSSAGIFSKTFRYMTSHKGLAFYTKSPETLRLPGNAEVVQAKKLWIPGEF